MISTNLRRIRKRKIDFNEVTSPDDLIKSEWAGLTVQPPIITLMNTTEVFPILIKYRTILFLPLKCVVFRIPPRPVARWTVRDGPSGNPAKMFQELSGKIFVSVSRFNNRRYNPDILPSVAKPILPVETTEPWRMRWILPVYEPAPDIYIKKNVLPHFKPFY